MKRGLIQVNLRMPRDLRERLIREARRRGVSLNYEMRERLTRSLDLWRDRPRKTEQAAGAEA
jgi:hypothetical protein